MKIAMGLDIGGTNIKAVMVSEEGEKLFGYKYPTPAISDNDRESCQGEFVNLTRDFIKRGEAHGISVNQIIGIGIGAAGIIDTKRGIIVDSPNIKTMADTALREIYKTEFRIPVTIENDANAYAYAEKWIGTGKGFNCFVALTLGTGLGGGFIYDGELFNGPFEVGHMVIEPNGRFCTCGNWGCLESYASGRAILDRATSSLEKGMQSIMIRFYDGNFYKLTPADIYKSALEGDVLGREVFKELGQYLGIGISNLINLLNPQAVIIGGGLIGAWDLFIDELKRECSKRVLKPLSSNIKILKSELEEDGGAIGAAGLLFRDLNTNTTRGNV